MIRTFACVLVGSLALNAPVWADVPLPGNLKYIDPVVQFEGVEAHPDYVFHLRFLTFTGGPANIPYRVVAVRDAKAFPLKAERRLINMQLLALNRQDFEKQAKADPSLAWLTDKTPGVLAAKVETPATTAPITVKTAPVTTYRVTLENGKLSVTQAAAKRSTALPGLLPTWALGLVGSFSLAWFGVWLARRNRPAQQQANATESGGV